MDRRAFIQRTAGGSVGLLCAPALAEILPTSDGTAAQLSMASIPVSVSSCSRYTSDDLIMCKRTVSAVFDLAGSLRISAVRLISLRNGSIFHGGDSCKISLYLTDDPLSQLSHSLAIWNVERSNEQSYEAHFAPRLLSARYVRLEGVVEAARDEAYWGAESESIADIEVLTGDGTLRISAMGQPVRPAARFGPPMKTRLKGV